MMTQTTIGFYKTRKVKDPTRGTVLSAGLDFYVPDDYEGIQALGPGQSRNIPSGIHMRLPQGSVLVMFNKSGIAVTKGLQVGACVIDADYQGEIHLHVMNVSDQTTFITPGMKLVQGLVFGIPATRLMRAESIKELYRGHESERGAGGFGSTGVL